MKNWISVFFISLIFMQSCRVYHVNSVPIEEAVQSEKRVKIHTRDGDKLKYKKIVIDSNQYYGVKKVKGALVKTPLDLDAIEKIRLHNKTLSIIMGVVVVLVSITAVTVVIFVHTWSPNLFSGAIIGPY